MENDPLKWLVEREFWEVYRTAVKVDRRAFPVVRSIQHSFHSRSLSMCRTFAASRDVIQSGDVFASGLSRVCPWVLPTDLFHDNRADTKDLFNSVCVNPEEGDDEHGSN